MESQNDVFQIVKTILSLAPEVEFFHKFGLLNKHIRHQMKQVQIGSIWHTDHSRLAKDFLCSLLDNFDVSNLKDINI
jgi:hypothetical protein